MAQLWRDLSCS